MGSGHAVVLGGGFAGLVTAGVLTSYYERVTVVERDPAPAPGAARRGVPQGRHAHNLLPKGAQLVEEIFPGILGEMAADGAVLADLLVGYRFHVAGKELPQVSIGAKSVHATRPFYEHHLRRRLLDRGGVRLLLGADVVGVVADDEACTRIIGVRIMRQEPSSTEETLAADLVVDATGRGARTPAWLEELGYERPQEERLPVDVAYASRIVGLTPAGAERAGYLVGGDNGTPRGVLLLAVEGGRHMLTVTGSGPQNRPPTDEPGFTDFLATAAPPDVFDAVLAGESLGETVAYRFPAAVWRRYERLPRFPAGLLVIGDALCSLNPLYAQGMTVAAMEAAALRRCLEAGRDDLSLRFFRAAAAEVAVAWQLAAGADSSQASGNAVRRLQATFMNRMFAAATRDGTVAAQLARVLVLLDPPASLIRPTMLWRVMTKGAPVESSGTSNGAVHSR